MYNMKNNISTETIHEMKIGKITYQIHSHFSKTSKDTVQNKIERLISHELDSA